MGKITTLIWLGIGIIIAPLLGVYSEWKTVFFVSAGALIVVIGFSLKNDFEESEPLPESGSEKSDSVHTSTGVVHDTLPEMVDSTEEQV